MNRTQAGYICSSIYSNGFTQGYFSDTAAVLAFVYR